MHLCKDTGLFSQNIEMFFIFLLICFWNQTEILSLLCLHSCVNESVSVLLKGDWTILDITSHVILFKLLMGHFSCKRRTLRSVRFSLLFNLSSLFTESKLKVNYTAFLQSQCALWDPPGSDSLQHSLHSTVLPPHMLFGGSVGQVINCIILSVV